MAMVNRRVDRTHWLGVVLPVVLALTVGGGAEPTAGATASQYGWDAQARLDEVSGDNAGEVSFTPADQVATVDTGTALTWNTNGQLTSTTTGSGTLTQFGYDANGNRTTASATDPATPTQTATTTYAWNAAGQLTSLTSPTGQASTYTYNGDGLRLTATSSDQATTNFVWDTATAVPRVLTADGQGYIYAGGSTPIAQITLTTGTAQYLHADLTGSVRAVTDSTGALVARTDYSTYGAPQSVTATDGSTLPAVATLTSFGYAGEYTDPTGLIYLRARWYDPNTAVFLSIDPLVDHTRNAYGYTGGNPLQYGDPLGLRSGDTPSQTVKFFFASEISAAEIVVGLGSMMTPGGSRAFTDKVTCDYRRNGGGWNGLLNSAVMNFNPMYSVVDSSVASWGSLRDGRLGDAAIELDSAIYVTALTAYSVRGPAASIAAKLPARAAPAAADIAAESGAARFLVNSAGDVLDTERVSIPEGKFDYLLKNPSKSGVFSGSMGFDQASLDSALRNQLTENFGSASPSVPMVGGGTKFTVKGPMAGPSGGQPWGITTAWGVDLDGTIRLITATP